MAYSFGGGVRPELGKTDYSGYLQGALTGAQGVAAGGAAIGQGIEKLGAGIGEGIKKYQENKVIVGQLTAKNEDALKDEKFKATLPAGAQALIKKAETNGNLGFKDASVLAAYVDAGKISQKETFNKTLSTQTAQAFGMMQKTGSTNLPLIYQNILPEARVAASNLFVNDQLKRAQTNQASGSAYASRNPTPKTPTPFNTLYQNGVRAWVEENPDTKITGTVLKKIATDAQKAASSGQGGVESTAAQKDAEQIIQSELKTGKLSNDPMAIEARRADLIGRGGRNEQQPTEKYYNAGTFVRRIDQGGAIAAVRSSKDGRIGTVGKDGEFEPLDSNEFQPISPGDVNTFLGAEAFSKLSDELITNENSINAFNKYIKGAGSLPTGLDKATTRLTALLKTSITKEPLSDDEMNMGLSQARQQGLLGALRTSILGPGVLTEIDAQRILDRLGGDIESIFTNPAIVKEAMMEVLDMKMNEYDQRLSIYNGHVVGRYGQASGYKQRARISPYTPEEAEMASDPYGAIAEMERRKKLKKKQ